MEHKIMLHFLFPRLNDLIYMEIIEKFYTRPDCKFDTSGMYLFADNGIRSSGKNLLKEQSYYYQKYKKWGNIYYPSTTSAVIRGLPNAFPVTTQMTYIPGYPGCGRWMDSDFEIFKSFIDDDISDILKFLGEYQKVIIPVGGFFGSKISQITPARCPLIYNYLNQKLNELFEIIKEAA